MPYRSPAIEHSDEFERETESFAEARETCAGAVRWYQDLIRFGGNVGGPTCRQQSDASNPNGQEPMAIPISGTATHSSPHAHHTNYSAMAMVTTLFFAWGFCTVLNDAVIPHYLAGPV